MFSCAAKNGVQVLDYECRVGRRTVLGEARAGKSEGGVERMSDATKISRYLMNGDLVKISARRSVNRMLRSPDRRVACLSLALVERIGQADLG